MVYQVWMWLHMYDCTNHVQFIFRYVFMVGYTTQYRHEYGSYTHIILIGHGVCLNVCRCSHFFGQSMCSHISVAQGYMYAIGIWLYIYNSTQTR